MPPTRSFAVCHPRLRRSALPSTLPPGRSCFAPRAEQARHRSSSDTWGFAHFAVPNREQREQTESQVSARSVKRENDSSWKCPQLRGSLQELAGFFSMIGALRSERAASREVRGLSIAPRRPSIERTVSSGASASSQSYDSSMFLSASPTGVALKVAERADVLL